jgi:hypothetical protein
MALQILMVLAVAAFAALGGFAVWWSQPANEAKRLLSEAPQKHLGELVDGDRARVRGIARRGAQLKTSLVTHRPCIGFRLNIEWLQDGFWHNAGEWVDCAPFELIADGAVARVEGPVLMGLEIDERGGYERPLTHAEHRAVTQLANDGLLRFRFREALLQDGDPIWVLGVASLFVDPRGARESPRSQPMLPVFRGTVQDPTVLADDRP